MTGPERWPGPVTHHERFPTGTTRPAPILGQHTDEALAELRRAAAARTPYPLILIDAVMPEPDGFALAEKILAEPGLASFRGGFDRGAGAVLEIVGHRREQLSLALAGREQGSEDLSPSSFRGGVGEGF